MNYYFIDTNNGSYALDIRQSLIYKVNVNYKERLMKFNIDTVEDLKNDSEIANLYAEGECFVENRIQDIKNKEYKLESLTIILTSACNLRCKYCYGGGEWEAKMMTREMAVAAVEFLVKNRDSLNLTIIFFGGEPLLNYPLMEYVVSYCKKIEQEKKIRFNYSITTNGTLISEKITSFLIDNRFHVNISIDGDKKTHNMCRCDANGLGTYDMVVDKISNIPVLNRTARGTITRKNIKIDELFYSLTGIGFSNVHFEIVSSEEENIKLQSKDIDLFIERYRKLCKDAYNIIMSGSNDVKERIYGPIKDDLEKISKQTFRTHFCKAAKKYVAVDVDGKLYPCHRYIGHSEYSIGNIFEGFNDNRKRYIEGSVFTKEKCKSCWARYLCGGGCDNEAEVINNNIKEPLEIKCELRKRMLIEGMKLYLRLREEGVDNIDKLFSD